MKRLIIFTFFLYVSAGRGYSQVVPNLSNQFIPPPTDQISGKLNASPVDIFTGLPHIYVPFYSYSSSNNGLGLNISLNYFPGGNQVAEVPTSVGPGWYLNAGGIITRSIRGAPDDRAVTGFMYAAAIPTDFRSNGDKYFFDSLDAQQDVFQFNFNGRTGKFYMGKNGKIAISPNSKMKIIPTIGSGTSAQRIVGFRIISEDGTKYDFNDAESTVITTKGADSSLFRSANTGQPYFSSWSLSKIIAPFSTDTIKLNYIQSTITNDFNFPQVTFVRSSDGVRTKTIAPIGKDSSVCLKISSIIFPDNTTATFNYNNIGLTQIKIRDTALRYGYSFDYLTEDDSLNAIIPLLKSITPYTSREKKEPYLFSYAPPYFPAKAVTDSFQNKRDYWGFYNGANNGNNLIPKVNGYTWGADRNPNAFYAKSGMLYYFKSPEGGATTYGYELNDHLPYTKSLQKLSVSPTTAYSNTILLSQVFNTKHQLVFILDSTVSRSGTAPITGTGNVTINIKNTAGTITYATFTLSLYNLFYQGRQSFVFNVPNGSYLLDKPAVTGTTITGSFPINISWENKLTDGTHTAIQSGGVRVNFTIQNDTDDWSSLFPTIYHEYRYVNIDGTSSGFMGDVPNYDYWYKETVNYGGSNTTSYNVISSDPMGTTNYSQGSAVGYNRVEVYDGQKTYHNLGKTVYDFTSLPDVNDGSFTPTFPYTFQDSRYWGIGLPKKISVYDSTGRLLKKTINNYSFDSTLYLNDNFKSLKIGNTYSYANGDPNSAATPVTRTYIAQEYYPITGRAKLTSTLDTIFNLNGTTNASYANFTYDTNYNVTKITTSFDRNRSLQLEKRLYYPYNYTIGGSIGKLRDSSILTALVSTESWITGDATPRIISGTITDYQQSGAYIKPYIIYALQSKAPVPQTTIGVFNPALLNRSATYFVPQSTFMSFDTKGNLLQSKNNQSGINNSVIMDYGKQYTVAKVSNASQSDIAYSSFESDGSGNWSIASALRDTVNAITGRKSYNLSNGNITKTSLVTATSYLITVWSKTGATVNVNGSALSTSLATQNGWNLYSKTITGISTVTISGSGLIDELRLQPKDANMVTYTYNPMVGITSAADPNNTITYNEYDNLNRLQFIRDKDKNIVKRYDYSDTVMAVSILPVWQKAKVCQDGISGLYDSTKTDINPLSNTYDSTYVIAGSGGTDYCTCSTPAAHPDYKLINGVCEQGDVCTTSSVYVPATGQWTCTYHYRWSDSSTSRYYTKSSSSSCPLGCVVEL